jgi:hypothetical protein
MLPLALRHAAVTAPETVRFWRANEYVMLLC